jgi:tetratricopeptide (TPR) repeat protein
MGLESQAAIEYRLAAHLDWRYQGPSILQEAATRISSVEALSALAGPERPETLPRLAWMLLERKDPRADQMARIAVERAPDEPMTALVASRTALGRGEIDEARRLAEGALANPGASQWLRIRATEVLWWSGLKEQAMERLRRILDGVSAQPDGEAWLEYGQWALSAGRMTEARIGFRRARAIGPTRMAARSLTEEARAELIAGRVLDAQVLLTRAGRLDPSLLDVPLLRAELFLRDGRREAAREQILRVLAADPDNGVAKALLERVDEIR